MNWPKRGVTADTVIRLARRFETSEEPWMNLQSHNEPAGIARQAHRDHAADGRVNIGPERRLVRKVVGYLVSNGRLLVFTHDDVPLEVAGVQVPAGTIEPGEQPAAAVVREVREETRIDARVVRALGIERYDLWPSKPEIHERHFFQLAPRGGGSEERWRAGEEAPSDGGVPQRWTCQWIPLERAHVLCAGFGARLGGIVLGTSGGATAEPSGRAGNAVARRPVGPTGSSPTGQ